MEVTVVVGEDGLVMDGVLGPLTNVHNPVPTKGVFPARVTLEAEHKD